jgi:hypothetical protein
MLSILWKFLIVFVAHGFTNIEKAKVVELYFESKGRGRYKNKPDLIYVRDRFVS